MKALYTLLIIIFLTKYSKESNCTSVIDPKNYTDCTKAYSKESELKCCYVNYTGLDNQTQPQPYEEVFCLEMNATQYENIIEYFKGEVGKRQNMSYVIQNATIECGAQYIIISMLSLILLFL